MTAQLYRHFNAAGELLYVGCSSNVVRRTEQHELTAHWLCDLATITVEHFASAEEALTAEAAAIRGEQPKYNLRGKSPDLRHTPKEREEWNAAALADNKQRAADLLSANPDKMHFGNTDIVRAGLKISGAVLQTGLIQKRKFGKQVVYCRADIEALANAPTTTWVIPAPRIQEIAA